MSVASSGSTDPVQELEALRELRAVLLDLCESPASPAAPFPLLGRAPCDQAEAPSPGTKGPGVKSVLASLSTLGAALERVGEGDAHSRSWRALETLQDVVEQWVGGAGVPPGPSDSPPAALPSGEIAAPVGPVLENEASRYYQRAEDDLGRLGSLKALSSLAVLGSRDPTGGDSLILGENGDVPSSSRSEPDA